MINRLTALNLIKTILSAILALHTINTEIGVARLGYRVIIQRRRQELDLFAANLAIDVITTMFGRLPGVDPARIGRRIDRTSLWLIGCRHGGRGGRLDRRP